MEGFKEGQKIVTLLGGAVWINSWNGFSIPFIDNETGETYLATEEGGYRYNLVVIIPVNENEFKMTFENHSFNQGQMNPVNTEMTGKKIFDRVRADKIKEIFLTTIKREREGD